MDIKWCCIGFCIVCSFLIDIEIRNVREYLKNKVLILNVEKCIVFDILIFYRLKMFLWWNIEVGIMSVLIYKLVNDRLMSK